MAADTRQNNYHALWKQRVDKGTHHVVLFVEICARWQKKKIISSISKQQRNLKLHGNYTPNIIYPRMLQFVKIALEFLTSGRAKEMSSYNQEQQSTFKWHGWWSWGCQGDLEAGKASSPRAIYPVLNEHHDLCFILHQPTAKGRNHVTSMKQPLLPCSSFMYLRCSFGIAF